MVQKLNQRWNNIRASVKKIITPHATAYIEECQRRAVIASRMDFSQFRFAPCDFYRVSHFTYFIRADFQSGARTRTQVRALLAHIKNLPNEVDAF